MFTFKPRPLRLALAGLLMPIALAGAMALVISCATTKADAITAGKDCAAAVGPEILKVVRDASFSAVASDLPAVLAGLKDCIAVDAAKVIADELAALGSQPGLAAQASAVTAVPVAVAKARLDAWLASHAHAMRLLDQGDYRLTYISDRMWRRLNAAPLPFLPVSVDC